MNPITNPKSYDVVVMNGIPTPGIAEVTGFGSPRIWDKLKGYAMSGAILRYIGNDLSKGSIKIRLFTTKHWDDWDLFAPIVAKAPKGTRAKAIDAYHPYLEALEIKAIVVEDVLQPVQETDGVWMIEIKVSAFAAPAPASSTPDGSGTEPPKDKWDQWTEDLTTQIDELAK